MTWVCGEAVKHSLLHSDSTTFETTTYLMSPKLTNNGAWFLKVPEVYRLGKLPLQAQPGRTGAAGVGVEERRSRLEHLPLPRLLRLGVFPAGGGR